MKELLLFGSGVIVGVVVTATILYFIVKKTFQG